MGDKWVMQVFFFLSDPFVLQFPEVTVHQFKTTLIHFYLTVPIRKKNLFLLVFIKEKSPSVPLKPTARHQVRPLHF